MKIIGVTLAIGPFAAVPGLIAAGSSSRTDLNLKYRPTPV
jgi:hypothetical protein